MMDHTLPEHSDALDRVRRHIHARRSSSNPNGKKAMSNKQLQQIKFMKQVSLFAEMSSKQLDNLARHLVRREFSEGECIFREGDPGRVLYLVESGQVRIFVDGLGSGIETSVILCGRPGDIFGELAIVDGLPRSASAVAMEPTAVYTMDRETFRVQMQRIPQLALNFMKLLSVRVRYNTKQVNSLASMSINSRLARLLLKLAQDYGTAAADGVRIDTSLTQTDLASLIGASRESTNKALSTFRRQALIRQADGHITIVDPDALRKKVRKV